MLNKITEILDEEMKQYPSPERRQLLGALADIRGTTGVALANIRVYLLSGDAKFAELLDKLVSGTTMASFCKTSLKIESRFVFVESVVAVHVLHIPAQQSLTAPPQSFYRPFLNWFVVGGNHFIIL